MALVTAAVALAVGHGGARAGLPPNSCDTGRPCASDDPCIQNVCFRDNCVPRDLPAITRAACVCLRPPVTECVGQPVPVSVKRSAAKACRSIANAGGGDPVREKRFLKQAVGRWKRAVRLAVQLKDDALSAECTSALRSSLRDARRRTRDALSASSAQ